MSFPSASGDVRVSYHRRRAVARAARLLALLFIGSLGPLAAADDAPPTASDADAPNELIVPGEFHYRAAPDFRPVEVRVESYIKGIREAIARRRTDG